MQTPTVGRIVHFHFDHGTRKTRPAVIVDVPQDEASIAVHALELHVFFGKDDLFAGDLTRVSYADGKGGVDDPKKIASDKAKRVQPATWSWPEIKVGEPKASSAKL